MGTHERTRPGIRSQRASRPSTGWFAPTCAVTASRRRSRLEIWRDWATEVQGAAIDCGHHVAEEKPHELAQLLLEFLAANTDNART